MKKKIIALIVTVGLLFGAGSTVAFAHSLSYSHNNCVSHGLVQDTWLEGGAGYAHNSALVQSNYPNYDVYASAHFFRTGWGQPWYSAHTVRWYTCWYA